MSSSEEKIIKKDISEFNMPLYNEIPDVGLYLKQVVKYINELLQPWFDIKVTESMLSNYVKMHMIPNAIKKQYYREQIASLIFIVLSKMVVSLDDIQLLLKIREERYECKAAYDYMRSELLSELQMRADQISDNNGETENKEKILMKNIISAIVQKYYIGKAFSELREEREE